MTLSDFVKLWTRQLALACQPSADDEERRITDLVDFAETVSAIHALIGSLMALSNDNRLCNDGAVAVWTMDDNSTLVSLHRYRPTGQEVEFINRTTKETRRASILEALAFFTNDQ